MIARVRSICEERRLRQVDVAVDGFGHTTFKVGKKSIVMIGGGTDGSGSLSIKADPVTQQALIRRGPYERTPYIGQHGWVTLRGNATIDWEEVSDLVADAWTGAAPKRLRDAVK